MNQLVSMEAFVRVADAAGFAEAARRWGRSKAAVSKYVAQLEHHLGLRLFQRTTRSVALTDAGRQHYERCRDILGLLADAEDQVRDDHLQPRGVLRVSAPPGFMSVVRRDVVTGFARRYPRVTLELDLTHRMVDLVEERVDVAIRLTKPVDSSLVARRLAPAPLTLVASPGYLDRAGRPTCPADLVSHECVRDTNFRFDPSWPFRVDGRSVHIKVTGSVRANSPLMVRDLAMDGLGIALTPRIVAIAEVRAGRLEELLPGTVDAGWSVYAVTSQRRLLAGRTRAFIDHLSGCLGDPSGAQYS